MKKLVILAIIVAFSALCSAQSIRPMVQDISSSLLENGTQVQLSWNISKETSAQISELLIYKNIGSIIKASTLSILTPVATISVSESLYTDTLNNNTANYYAIVARTLDGTIYDVIIPTVNATDKAVVRTKNEYVVQSITNTQDNSLAEASPRIDTSIKAPLRDRPLPYVDVLSDNSEKNPPIITTETLHAIQTLPTQEATAIYFKPYIINEDTNVENATGDDYTLAVIVDSFVIHEHWSDAEKELLKFLQINRSKDSTARANFYLAQSYYFQGDYRKSLAHFQKSEKLYPMQSKKWIEEVLNKFTIS